MYILYFAFETKTMSENLYAFLLYTNLLGVLGYRIRNIQNSRTRYILLLQVNGLYICYFVINYVCTFFMLRSKQRPCMNKLFAFLAVNKFRIHVLGYM